MLSAQGLQCGPTAVSWPSMQEADSSVTSSPRTKMQNLGNRSHHALHQCLLSLRHHRGCSKSLSLCCGKWKQVYSWHGGSRVNDPSVSAPWKPQSALRTLQWRLDKPVSLFSCIINSLCFLGAVGLHQRSQSIWSQLFCVCLFFPRHPCYVSQTLLHRAKHCLGGCLAFSHERSHRGAAVCCLSRLHFMGSAKRLLHISACKHSILLTVPWKALLMPSLPEDDALESCIKRKISHSLRKFYPTRKHC